MLVYVIEPFSLKINGTIPASILVNYHTDRFTKYRPTYEWASKTCQS